MEENNEEMILDLRFSDFKSLDESLSERNKYRDIRKAIKRALDDEMELLINLHFTYIHTQADGDKVELQTIHRQSFHNHGEGPTRAISWLKAPTHYGKQELTYSKVSSCEVGTKTQLF